MNLRTRTLIGMGLALACALAAPAAPGPWVLALDTVQGEAPLVLVVAERDGNLVGEAYPSPAVPTPVAVDVTKLARTDTTLTGDVTVEKIGAYTLDVAVKDGALTGTYTGTTGDRKVEGAVRWGADRLPLGHALFYPSAARALGWRGDGSGRYKGAAPVIDWDLKTGRNVVWQTKLPFYSASGPIVVGDRVFTTAEPDWLICLDAKTGTELWRRHNAIHMEKYPEVEREKMYAQADVALDAADKWLGLGGLFEGKVINYLEVAHVWTPVTKSFAAKYGKPSIEGFEAEYQQVADVLGIDLAAVRASFADIGVADKIAPRKLPAREALLVTQYPGWAGNTAATPASDGTVVVTKVAATGPAGWGYLVCYDLAGTRLWSVDIGMTGNWNMSYNSPIIIGDKVIVQHKRHPGKDYSGKNVLVGGLAAYDIATGKQVWTVGLQESCSSPIAFQIDGVSLVHCGSLVMLPDTGDVVCDLRKFFGVDVDTPVGDGDLFYSRGAEGKFLANEGASGRACRSAILRFAWTTRGKELGYEVVWQAPLGSFWSNNWHRGSSMLNDGWLFCSRQTGMNPWLVGYDTGASKELSLKLAPAQCVIKPGTSGRGVPSEDDMSVAMGGGYLFACPSNWPSQFIVANVPPEPKVVAAPVLDSPMVGSPFFQGGRTYMRSYRYLYCFGDPAQPYQSPAAPQTKE